MDLQNLQMDSFERVIQDSAFVLSESGSVEEAAEHLSKTLFDSCYTGKTGKALVLSRVFLSLPYFELPDDLQHFIGSAPSAKDLFLVLVGTSGIEAEWNDRRQSRTHQAIPLNRESIRSIPMISRCFQQIGFNMDILLKEENGIAFGGIPASSFGTFYVEEAIGSPYVPSQNDFVKRYGVRSVIGGGTMLPDGAVSVWIGFTNVHISQEDTAPIIRLMPAFWKTCYPLYQTKRIFS